MLHYVYVTISPRPECVQRNPSMHPLKPLIPQLPFPLGLCDWEALVALQRSLLGIPQQAPMSLHGYSYPALVLHTLSSFGLIGLLWACYTTTMTAHASDTLRHDAMVRVIPLPRSGVR